MRLFVLIAFILTLVSCGKESGARCFTRSEAMLACRAKTIQELNVTDETATLICGPYYAAEACYYL